MPKLSEFYGIVIEMYPREVERHVPHFHARYGGWRASLEISTLEVIAGSLPKTALALTKEWAGEHRNELQQAWEALRAGRIPTKIAPLQ